MPIQFAPAEPFSGDAGAAQIIQSGLANLIHVYDINQRQQTAYAEMASRAHQHAAELAARATEASDRNRLDWARLYQAGAMHADDVGMRGAALAASIGEANARLAQAASAQQQQYGVQQQHIALESMRLTYPEEVRLQRLQQGLAEVQNDPNLTDEEKGVVSLKLRTGIDLYHERQERARTAAIQQAQQGMMHQQGLADAISSVRRDFQAGNLAQGVVEHTTPSGETYQFLVDYQGRVTPLTPERTPRTSAAGGTGEGAIERGAGGEFPGAVGGLLPRQEWERRYDRAATLARQLWGRSDQNPTGMTGDTLHGQINQLAARWQLGDTGTYEGYLQAHGAGAGMPRMRPIDESQPSTWTAPQRQRLEDFNNAQRQIDALPEAARLPAYAMLTRLSEMYVASGGRENMPEPMQRRYDRLLAQFRESMAAHMPWWSRHAFMEASAPAPPDAGGGVTAVSPPGGVVAGGGEEFDRGPRFTGRY